MMDELFGLLNRLLVRLIQAAALTAAAVVVLTGLCLVFLLCWHLIRVL